MFKIQIMNKKIVYTIFISPFPEVAESVQQELESYRTQEDEVKRLKSIMVRFIDIIKMLFWDFIGFFKYIDIFKIRWKCNAG